MNYDYDDWLSNELKKGPLWGSFFIVYHCAYSLDFLIASGILVT